MVPVLHGRTALVTGSSRGIGRGIAVALAHAGADVVVNYRSDRAAADDLVERLNRNGGRAVAVQADVGQREQVERLFDEAAAALGVPEIVVANAGSSIRRSFLETTAEQLRQTLDTLVFGAFHTLQEGARRLIAAQKPGAMVVIGSVHADLPFVNALSYNVGKAALHHLARTAAAELLPHGIRVNVVVPGLTDTPGERNFRTEAELAEAAKQLPLGRMGTSEEVGQLVAFLVSPANEYMTGSIVTADGGIGVNLSVGLRSQPGG